MNEQIREYLEFYITLPESPQFAVLISGVWGSGKSFFVRNFIKDHSTTQFLYISLYGVTSTKDITDQIFEQLHPVLASKGMKILGKIGAAVLKGTVKIDLTHSSNLDLNTAFSQIKLPEYLTNADKRILIFDDLERCSMDIVHILGYINQFVETNGNKVIIIANEDEIQDAKGAPTPEHSDKQKDKKYLRTKEKIIGKSFILEADIEAAATEFFKSIRNEKLKKYIDAHRDLIIDTYKAAKYNNLRHLKQMVLDLDRLFDILPPIAFQKDTLVNDLVHTLIALASELKVGRHLDEIGKLYSAAMSSETEDGTLLMDLRQKYSIFRVPISVTFWAEFFSKGTFKNKTEIAQSISNSEYFREENTPTEIKLWRWWFLDDDVFAATLTKVAEILYSSSIDNQYLLSHIVSILMSLSAEKLYDVPNKELLEKAKENIDRLKDAGKLVVEIHNDITMSAYAGLGYNARDLDEFKEYWEYLKNAAKATLPKTYGEQGKALLTDLGCSPQLFTEQITIGNTSQNKYYDKPVLASIEPKDFVQKYMELSNYDKGLVNQALGKRYTHLELMADLGPEADWLRQVKDLLAKEALNPNLSVTKIYLNAAVETLNKAITHLAAVLPPAS